MSDNKLISIKEASEMAVIIIAQLEAQGVRGHSSIMVLKSACALVETAVNTEAGKMLLQATINGILNPLRPE